MRLWERNVHTFIHTHIHSFPPSRKPTARSWGRLLCAAAITTQVYSRYSKLMNPKHAPCFPCRLRPTARSGSGALTHPHPCSASTQPHMHTFTHPHIHTFTPAFTHSGLPRHLGAEHSRIQTFTSSHIHTPTPASTPSGLPRHPGARSSRLARRAARALRFHVVLASRKEQSGRCRNPRAKVGARVQSKTNKIKEPPDPDLADQTRQRSNKKIK